MRALVVSSVGLVLLLVGVGLFDWRWCLVVLGACMVWMGLVGEFDE